MTSIPEACFSLTAGADKLALYQWNSRVAQHYFCSICGVYTHHRRRSVPDHFAINVACLDDGNLTEGRTVGLLDGASNPVATQSPDSSLKAGK